MRGSALVVAATLVMVVSSAACIDDDSGPATFVIDDVAFPAEPLEVDGGELVEVVNRDPVAHTVTSDAGGFDLGLDAESTARFAVPQEPGDYPVVCRIHPTMTAAITVRE
jgi:plastocyanin